MIKKANVTSVYIDIIESPILLHIVDYTYKTDI